MGWKERLRQEFFEADREFVEGVLPLGSVNQAAFALIAEATSYALVREGEEVHIRAEVVAMREILQSLARGGMTVNPKEAEEAVQRFASLWEAKARARGSWEDAVHRAQETGEITEVSQKSRRAWPWRR